MVKVSIVIPVYNTEKYIAECIESCLNQTYDDYEIIIVDDGSTDKTGDIICGYREANKDKITVIHKENGGTASALNTGLEMMKGEWFKWVSADDVLDRHAIRDMMFLIDQVPNNQQYIFYTNFLRIDKNGKVIEPHDEPDRSHLDRDLKAVELLHHFYGNGSTSMIHKNLFHIVGMFREGISHNEDLEFWMRACIKFKMELYFLPLRTLKYRIHSGQLTHTKDIDENAELVESFRKEYKPYLTDVQENYLKKLDSTIKLRRRMLKKIPRPIRNRIITVYRKIK